MLGIDFRPLVKSSLPKEFPVRFIVQLSGSNQFKVQQMVLLGIHIDGVDMPGTGQRVVNRVTTRRCDHHHTVCRRQFQRDSIQARIFPALVVDDIAAVDDIEPCLTESFDNHLQSIRREFQDARVGVDVHKGHDHRARKGTSDMFPKQNRILNRSRLRMTSRGRKSLSVAGIGEPAWSMWGLGS